MTNTVEVSPEFKRDIKPLAKKCHTLKKSVEDLQKALVKNPNLGVSYRANALKLCKVQLGGAFGAPPGCSHHFL